MRCVIGCLLIDLRDILSRIIVLWVVVRVSSMLLLFACRDRVEWLTNKSLLNITMRKQLTSNKLLIVKYTLKSQSYRLRETTQGRRQQVDIDIYMLGV
jgi:hypothetical protein